MLLSRRGIAPVILGLLRPNIHGILGLYPDTHVDDAVVHARLCLYTALRLDDLVGAAHIPFHSQGRASASRSYTPTRPSVQRIARDMKANATSQKNEL